MKKENVPSQTDLDAANDALYQAEMEVEEAENLVPGNKLDLTYEQLQSYLMKVEAGGDNWNATIGAMYKAQAIRGMTAIIGVSGAGKTTICEYFAEEDASVILIRLDKSLNHNHMMSMLLERLNWTTTKHITRTDLLKHDLILACQGKDLTFVIDEANRITILGFEMLRVICDHCPDLTVLLVGQPELRDIIRKGQGGGEMGQVFTRVNRLEVMQRKDSDVIYSRYIEHGLAAELAEAGADTAENMRQANFLLRNLHIRARIKEVSMGDLIMNDLRKEQASLIGGLYS